MTRPGLSEFEFIRSRLAPLSYDAQGAAGLTDDGAVLDLGPGERLAVTSDTLIEGRHFPSGEDPSLAARKALRVNLSDLAAMGAKPFAYTAGIVWPLDGFAERADGFVAGLALDQARYGVRLIGGDTTSAEAPWTLSITAFGRLPAGVSLRRGRAQAGDTLIVTGTIGDAGLGLGAAQGGWAPASPDQRAHLAERLQLPEPRLSVGLAARDVANAAIDVSDGLLSEARHIAEASGLCAVVDLDRMPLSDAALAWLAVQTDAKAGRLDLASSGDDYELLLAVPERRQAAFLEACERLSVRATVIGRLDAARETGGLHVTAEGQRVKPPRLGFTQF
jgi:thiamine-monophosphate kinase